MFDILGVAGLVAFAYVLIGAGHVVLFYIVTKRVYLIMIVLWLPVWLVWWQNKKQQRKKDLKRSEGE